MAERLADLRTPEGDLPDERYEPPAPPKPTWKQRLRAHRPEQPRLAPRTPRISGDTIVGGLGVALGLVCALFPWYIFMNPEKFKLEGYHFSGRPQAAHSASASSGPMRTGAPADPLETDQAALDMFPTGTVPEPRKQPPPVSADDQPFPGNGPKKPNFNLVEVANGRAMIEDADGLWVVKVGSPLPNDSRVAAIEQRNGNWVLVTSAKDVIELRK
ncbi:MAG: hypothetical protein BGN87_21970 [Rhizobiales bacterium 65-79]|jgi:hypothetical protein|nr:hypothetical protein [Hyphomicrobiales bacterium]OJU04175.1 MAG: hypothetical protein BGN87_21970 [Rhizobiales bacterium 65-79]